MPGLVAFGRRWSVGSDDLVIPALASLAFDAFWVVVLSLAFPSIAAEVGGGLGKEPPDTLLDPLDTYYRYQEVDSRDPLRLLRLLHSAFIAVLLLCVMVEGSLCYVSTRGTVTSEAARMPGTLWLLYARALLLLPSLALCGLGLAWLGLFFGRFSELLAARTLVAVVVAEVAVLTSVAFLVWCAYDTAGRNWVRHRRAKSLAAGGGPVPWDEEMRRSFAAPKRNLRHSHMELVYRASWRRRVRLALCCVRPKTHARRRSTRNRAMSRPRAMSVVSFGLAEEQDSFSEVARLLSDFFWESDVVASDLVAGLILLRKQQQAEKRRVLAEAKETYQFLSGAAITPETAFLDLGQPAALQTLKDHRWMMSYALAAYGWPFYLRYGDAVCWNLLAHSSTRRDPRAVEDNCLGWNLAALHLTLPNPDHSTVLYANFHCEVGETPFFAAVDKERREVIVSIRGTLSLRDIMTDLTANLEEIPIEPRPPTPFLGHAGIVRAAVYVLAELRANGVLAKAHEVLGEGGGRLVLVGHSLGAGAATVLGLMLRGTYPDLVCYAFSPPGGLLSWEGAEATRDWVRTVVVGKDCVARLGLAQMDVLRAQLTHLLSHCRETKWKVIGTSFPCCAHPQMDDAVEPLVDLPPPQPLCTQDSCQKLFLPGRILHVVRTWTKESRKSGSPEFAALWTLPVGAFDHVLVSPVMIHDHMPDGIIEALDKVVARSQRLIDESTAAATVFPEVTTSGSFDASKMSLQIDTVAAFPHLEGVTVEPAHQEIIATKSMPSSVGILITTQPLRMENPKGDGTPPPRGPPKTVVWSDINERESGDGEEETGESPPAWPEEEEVVEEDEDQEPEEGEVEEGEVFNPGSAECLDRLGKRDAKGDVRRTKSTLEGDDEASTSSHPPVKHVKSEAYVADESLNPLHRCKEEEDLSDSHYQHK